MASWTGIAALRNPVDLRALHIVLRAARASAERRDARIVEPLDERERSVRAQAVDRHEHRGANDAGPAAAREAVHVDIRALAQASRHEQDQPNELVVGLLCARGLPAMDGGLLTKGKAVCRGTAPTTPSCRLHAVRSAYSESNSH